MKHSYLFILRVTHSLKVVLVLLMCFAGHAAWAQVSPAKTKFKKSPVGVPFVERAQSAAPKTRGAMAEEMLNYAYCGDLEQMSAIGVGMATDHNTAIYVPGDLAANATICALEFYVVATNINNIKIWASTSLPESPDAADLAVKSVASLNIKPGEVVTQMFSEPVSIPESGLFVGVSYDITALNEENDSYPIVFAPLSLGYPATCFFQCDRQEDPTWMDIGVDEYGLYLGAKISGEFSENSVAVADGFSQIYLMSGTEKTVQVPLKNYSAGEGVTSISYTIESASGASAGEKEVKLSTPLSALMSTAYVEIPMSAGSEAKSEERTVTITKVNGVANTCSSNVATGLVTTISKMAESVPVMEEFTGGWCGYCPRGAVALEMLNEKYGDGVVTIAAHAGDAMEIPEYAFLTYSAPGFPSSTVNRGDFIDPYYSGMNAVAEAKKAGSPAKIALECEWADEAKTSIRMTSTSTFFFNQDESNFGVGYVLLQDGMTGTGNGWTQSNYFSGDSNYADDPNLAPLIDLPSTINGYEFNHVAIAAWGVGYGLEGSLPGSVVADEAKEHTYTRKIDDLKLLQNKEKLTVVALLIDRNTGAILNGTKSKILEQSIAVEDVTIDNIKYYLENGEATIMAQAKSLSGDIVIPESVSYNNVEYKVTNISASAFMGTKITSITLPNSITKLGNQSFYGCKSLTEIFVAKNNVAYSPERGVLYNKQKTTRTAAFGTSASVTLPEGLTSIGSEAFSGCSSLTSMTLPEGLASIGDRAFYDCESLTDIYCQNPVPCILGTETFDYSASQTLHVPAGSLAAYQSADGWSDFKNIAEIKDELPKYEVRWMVDGEIIQRDSVTVGEPIVYSGEIPTKDGYIFSGWSEIPKTMPAEDVTITGTFVFDYNTDAYKRLNGQIAELQNSLNAAKETINTECADVTAQFVEQITSIQNSIDALSADVKAKYEAGELSAESNIDTASVVAAIEKLLADAQSAQQAYEAEQAKIAANEAAYTKLMQEIAELQAKLDAAKESINTECADVAEQFAEQLASIQNAIDALLNDINAQYANCALTVESTINVADVIVSIETTTEAAAEAQEEYEETVGIDGVGSNGAKVKAIYNLNGKRVSTTKPNQMYIIEYSDGRKVKAIVKK